MSKAEHTSTPWVAHGCRVEDIAGDRIGGMDTPELVEQVVRAVNAHDALVAACA